ncbi:MAG: ABC transporter permease, partial [Bacteroidota bacterium]|nr:ABC transporter permease [Bacteroidota bacterium]
RNGDRIYRVVTEIHNENNGKTPGVPPPFTKAFRSDYTFAEKTARVVGFGGVTVSLPEEKEMKKFQEDDGVACAETPFFDIFNFPLAEGSGYHVLNEPNKALITERIARKYFGTTHAIGKKIRVDTRIDFVVAGILIDLPQNTDRRHEIYLSDYNLKDFSPWIADDKSWGGINSETHCFVLLKPGVQPEQVEKVFPSMKRKYYSDGDKNTFFFKLQPLRDIHFNPDYNGYVEKKYIWALALVALFLVTTACVNFINLATAQAVNRAKEVGIRKVLGGLKRQLFWQFIAETALITLFALLVAYGLAWLGLPWLNGLFQTKLSVNPFSSPLLIIYTLGIGLLVTFLSGSYPGLVLSGFQPIAALKGKLSQKNLGGFSLRRALVVFQFGISQLLIVGTIVIAGQMEYSRHSDLGFSKDAVAMIPVPITDSTGKGRMETLHNRIAQVPGVEKISFCSQAPAASSNNTTGIKYQGRPKEEAWDINTKLADDQYLATFGIKLVAGRNLFPSDTVREYLLNETAVKRLNVGNPADIINKQVTINGKEAMVVGVMKDFNNYSFRMEIYPQSISTGYNGYDNCAVKLNMANLSSAKASIEKIWNEVYPEYVYNFQFLDDRIANFYELDTIMLKLIKAFAGIAIFIGCLGLYGLVSFMAVQKTKEIGVRKVLGASLPNILWLFGKEFTRLLVIAFLIAAPLAWWAMHAYLQDFKFRIPMSPYIFLLAIGVSFLIAAITVGYKSIRAALANPVKSLRTE